MVLKLNVWRVRVKRAVEDWVELSAESGEQAECEAAKLPGILSVFSRSAILGNKLAKEPFVGVEDV